MPDTTPVYGLPYPCPGDTVDATDFQDLALAVEATLVNVDADYLLALNRFNTDLGGATQTIAAGVDTVITTPQYVIPADGIWVVSAHLFNANTPPTINSMRIRVRQGVTVRFGFTANTEVNTPRRVIADGPIVAAAGDVISTTVLYSGTGTMDVFVDLTAKMLCRIA